MYYKLLLYICFLSSLSIKLVGAHLGSASGDMHLETEKVKYEDINGYKKSSGDDQTFDDNPKAGALRNYKGGYDTQNNQVYLNTDKTDISKGSDIQRSLFTEQQRKETHDSKRLNKLSDKQQKSLAYDRGDRAAKMWDRFSDPATKSNSAAVQEQTARVEYMNGIIVMEPLKNIIKEASI